MKRVGDLQRFGDVEARSGWQSGRQREPRQLAAVARELDDELAARVEHVDRSLRVDGLDPVRAGRRSLPAWHEVDARGGRDERVATVALQVTGGGHDPDIAVDSERSGRVRRERRREIPDGRAKANAVVRLVLPQL